ncbi:unnamed protein product [Alopecurus aequalis]
MEFAARGRSTAAVYGDGDDRRFTDPPPPHGRDAHSGPANMAALVFRREELLREFHRERTRLDMILCDLAETERAMTACLAMPAAGWGAWCGRPLMHQCEETLYQTPRSSEETSWWRWNPLETVIPPAYPHVERSPSPVPQQRPVDDAEQQQERDTSSMALAVAPSTSRNAEQRWSLSKEPAVEALVQAAINAVANPMGPALFHEKVALESQAAVHQEHKQEMMESHGEQLTESGIQRSEQPKCPANGEESEADTKNSHAMQLMESELQRSEHPIHAAVSQQHEAEAKDSHAMQVMECKVQRSEQLTRAAIGHGHETKVNFSHAVQVMESKFQRNEQVKHGVAGQEKEAEVKDSHEVPMKSEIQISEQPKREAFGQEHEAEEKERHAVQPMGETGIQSSKQPKPAKPTIEDRINELRKLPHQYALAGTDKSPPNEQKRVVFNEPKTQITPCGVKKRPIMRINRQKPFEESSCTLGFVNVTVLQSSQGAACLTAKSTPESSHPSCNNDMESEIQRSEQPKRSSLGQEREAEAKSSHAVQLMENEIQRSEQTNPEAVGEERKAEDKDSHAGQLTKESGIHSSEQPKPAEPTFRDGIDERGQSPHALPVKEIQRSEPTKREAFGEERKAEEKDSHARQLMKESSIQSNEQPKPAEPTFRDGIDERRQSPHALPVKEIQRSEQTKREAFGEERKAEEKDSHAKQLMKESSIQSNEQPKPAEPTFRDGIDVHRQSPHALPVKEKSPCNEHKKLVFNETKTQTTPSGVKRPILRPTVTTPPPKRQKPLDEWGCTLCHLNLTCEEDLTQHKAEELHRSNLAALRARHEASGFDLRNQLKGRSQQESTQTLRTVEGGNEGGKLAVDRWGEDPRKKFMSKPFCKLCKAVCPNEKAMEMHLVGKRHRANLQGHY